MKQDEVKCELLVLDYDCSSDEITKLLGTDPSEVIKKGDIKRADPNGANPPVLHKRNVWVLKSELPTTATIEEHVDFMLKKLRAYAEGISELASKYPIELSIYGYIYQAQVGIHFEKSQIKEIAGLNLELDIDFYSLD